MFKKRTKQLEDKLDNIPNKKDKVKANSFQYVWKSFVILEYIAVFWYLSTNWGPELFYRLFGERIEDRKQLYGYVDEQKKILGIEDKIIKINFIEDGGWQDYGSRRDKENINTYILDVPPDNQICPVLRHETAHVAAGHCDEPGALSRDGSLTKYILKQEAQVNIYAVTGLKLWKKK